MPNNKEPTSNVNSRLWDLIDQYNRYKIDWARLVDEAGKLLPTWRGNEVVNYIRKLMGN